MFCWDIVEYSCVVFCTLCFSAGVCMPQGWDRTSFNKCLSFSCCHFLRIVCYADKDQPAAEILRLQGAIDKYWRASSSGSRT